MHQTRLTCCVAQPVWQGAGIPGFAGHAIQTKPEIILDDIANSKALGRGLTKVGRFWQDNS
jgi:hypothetical protein